MSGWAALQRAWLLSVLIHALPLLAWGWFNARTPEPQPQSQLTLELFGMVSQRQVAEQAPETPPPPEQPPPEKRVVAPRLTTVKRTQDQQAVTVPDVLEEVVQRDEPPPPTPPTQAPKAEAQVAQKLATAEDEQAAIRRYVAGLSKALQRKLVYPSGARTAGAIGAPTIAFTLTEKGAIEPDTLKVYKSSGFALLDESALQAARDAVPFQAPPKRMNIVVAVSFAEIH